MYGEELGKQAEMSTIAETKIEDIRHVLNRIEKILRPILLVSESTPLARPTSDPVPVRQPSSLLVGLDQLLQYAADLENRISF